MKIAFVLFTYKRINTLKRVLKSYNIPNGLDCYCFIDYSEKQEEVASLVGKYGFNIIRREVNYGLNKNIVSGINEVFDMGYDALVISEDDILFGQDAFYYLINGLITLKNDPYCGSVTLSRDMEFNDKFYCWGYGIWKDRWEKHIYVENGITHDIQLDEFHRRNKLYCYCSQVRRNFHIGVVGEHYSWHSRFGVRPILRKLYKNLRRYDIYFRALLPRT